MMKQGWSVAIFLFFTMIFAVPTASAMYTEPKVYSSFESFQKGTDAVICKKVTDGCNEWYFSNGIKKDPIKLCKLTSSFVYKWSCAEYGDTTVFLVGNTPSFTVEARLTSEEQDLYETLQVELDYTQEERVNQVLKRYYNGLLDYSIFSQELYTQLVREMTDTYILKTMLKYSENGILLGEGNNIFKMLQLLKLELKLQR